MKGVYSNFARKQLEKYGWVEGSGIGKSVTGRPEPVKAYMKRDSAGLGFDPAAKHTSGWWDDVFAQALNKVPVNPIEECTENKAKSEDTKVSTSTSSALYRRFSKVSVLTGMTSLEGEVSIKKRRKKKKEDNQQYNHENDVQDDECDNRQRQSKEFPEVEKRKRKKDKKERRWRELSENDETKDETERRIKRKRRKEEQKKSEENLFQECEGMTAHPSARHGVGMSGKLARVAKMDAELMRRMQAAVA